MQTAQRRPFAGPSHGTRCRAIALFFLGLWAQVSSAGAAVWSVSAATEDLALPTVTEVLEDQEPGGVNVSARKRYLVRRDFECEYRGKVDAKGKGEVDMYFVVPT